MQPRNIKTLGFNFFGGNAEGCLFVEHPEDLKATFNAIEAAKAFMKESESQWVEMTMYGKDGKKELVNMYSEQFSHERTVKIMAAKPLELATAVAKPVVVPKPTALDLDPYNWSYHN